MRTQEEIIENYRNKYFEEFGEEITFDKAHEHLTRIVRLLKALRQLHRDAAGGIDRSR